MLPTYQGRGIGTAIAHWLQDKARAAGSPRIGTQVAQGSAADRLLADLGYEVRWTAWDLELPADREISARPLPDGFTLRDAEEADREAAWTLVEDCFLEWSDRERMSLADFGARVWDRGGFEPWNLRLLVSPDGQVVGATHVFLAGEGGYVARIAVRPTAGPGSRPHDAGRRLRPGAGSTAPSAATSPPTPGRGRGGSTRRSAWRSRRPG